MPDPKHTKKSNRLSQRAVHGIGSHKMTSLEVRNLDPARFCCRLSSSLVPAGLDRFDHPLVMPQPLIVNPHCWFSWKIAANTEGTECAPLLTGFNLKGDIVWVMDPNLRTRFPYVVGTEYREMLRKARPGAPAPSGLPKKALKALSLGRILVDPDRQKRLDRDWAHTLSLCQRKFREGYCTISGLIPPLQLAELRRYYRFLIRRGVIKLGDRQVARRYYAHNESVARFFHAQLTQVVETIVNEPVKPSFVYFVSYVDGAKLARHTDRAQCVFTITLLIDCSPEPEFESPWPIHLITKTGKVAVSQAIGDALLYRGTVIPHYRNLLPRGMESTSLIFSYVPRDFQGPLD
jgi:hypothetical protein